MKKSIKSIVTLVCICAVVAILLAITNSFTAPKIAKNEEEKAEAALKEVMPNADDFDEISLDKYKLPKTVVGAHKAIKGEKTIGYVIKLSTSGYKEGLTIMCGVSIDGKILKTKCISNQETPSIGGEAIKKYANIFDGKGLNDVDSVNTVSGATVTTTAYRSAIKDALNAAIILGGGSVDLRTEEEKFYDDLNKSLLSLLPNGGSFEKLDLSGYTLPKTVTEAYKAKNGGYVIKTVTSGYGEGLTIMCGVNANGTVNKAICLASNETLGKEQTYGDNFAGKDTAGVGAVDTISGATLTTGAYRSAVKDALNAAIILGGGSVDIRTEEEILQDFLDAALPAAEGKFTKLFITENTFGINDIYKAENSSGFVCVIGEEFVVTDAQGNVTASTVDPATKELASNAVKSMIASTLTDINLSEYAGLSSQLVWAKKTATGNYVLEIKGAGYGINGGSQYHPASGKYIIIQVSITKDGKILDCLTVSQEETDGIGSVCEKESFYSQFDGKTETDYKNIDAISGATLTTNGYLKAIERAFESVKIFEGGAN